MTIKTLILISLVALTTQSSDDWAIQVEYHSSVNLTCSERNNQTEGESYLTDVIWIIPSGQVFRADATKSGPVNVKLLKNGTILQVDDVDDADFGVYYCIAKRNGDDWVVKKGINVFGPYFGDLTAKYYPKAKTGGIAACLTFLIASSICFVYDRNQQKGEREIENAQTPTKRRSSENAGVINPAMDMKEIVYENVDITCDSEKGISYNIDTHF